MAERPLFPVLFVSALLLAHYQRALKACRPDRGALGLLLKSWWLGPRALPLGPVQRASSHSYSLSLEEDFCSDEMGHTSLMLLENGRPLPLPHCNSVKKIASQGQGRWVHVGRKIFFAPTDNADLATTPRQYHLIDGLGGNPEIYGALSKLAQLKPTFPNPAAYALAKLQLVLGKRLTVGNSRSLDASHLLLENLRLGLDAAALPDLAIARLELETGPAGSFRADFSGIALGGVELDAMRLAGNFSADYQPRFTGLSLRHAGKTLVELEAPAGPDGTMSCLLRLACLDKLRGQLAALCGSKAEAGAWLTGFLAELASGHPDWRLRLTPVDMAGLVMALTSEGSADTLQLRLDFSADGTCQLRLESPRLEVGQDASAVTPPHPVEARVMPQAGLPPDWLEQLGKPLDTDFARRLEAILPVGTPVAMPRGIPRFVESDRYAGSFSFQWTTYTDTQLDSQQGVSLTEQDLILKTGFSPEEVAGKLVLDAGVGTGRHAEVLARWGARVVGVDLSLAVETARDNLARFPNAMVMQADIGALPFLPESFDIIYSIGVLHHTPDTRAYAARLLPLLKPGGTLALWVYPPKFQRRAEWVPMVSRLPPQAFQTWCEWIIDLARPHRDRAWVEAFIRQFPFATHHPTAQRSVLALFDGYTPTYHWTHASEELAHWYRQWGLEDVRILEEPTAVRGRKPDMG